jgi:hypothetical protein
MAQCRGSKRDGSQCTATVNSPQSYCWWHDPANAQQRKNAARKGGRRAGRGRPMAELATLKAQLSDLYTSVLTDMVDPKAGAVCAQITNAQIRITEVELRVREQTELIERIAQLEQAAKEQQGGMSRWGS